MLRQTKINNDFTQLIKHDSSDLGQESGRSEPNQPFPGSKAVPLRRLISIVSISGTLQSPWRVNKPTKHFHSGFLSFLTPPSLSVDIVDKWNAPVLCYNPRCIAGLAQVWAFNGSADDDERFIDTRMIYGTVRSRGGVRGPRRPGRRLPSDLICIHSISVMTHTTNEAPTGQESPPSRCRLIPQRKRVCNPSPGTYSCTAAHV